MAVWLYRKLVEYRARRRQKGKILNLPGEEGVRNDLQILYPSLKAGRQEILYHLKKTEKLLALLFAGVLLAGSLHVRSLFSGMCRKTGRFQGQKWEAATEVSVSKHSHLKRMQTVHSKEITGLIP
jgi:hypothetical protein